MSGGMTWLFRTKVWHWFDIWLLKVSVLLFGVAAGACFHDAVTPGLWAVLAAAVLLAVRPAVVYFRD